MRGAHLRLEAEPLQFYLDLNDGGAPQEIARVRKILVYL
jgi:hypothetical protein